MDTPTRKGTGKTENLPVWEDVIHDAFGRSGTTLTLSALYERVDGHPRTKINPHWKDKIRQVLQRSPLFESVRRGVWRLNASASGKKA